MKTPSRVAVVHGVFVLFALALIVQAAKVQVVDGQTWARKAKRQHFAASALTAPRGEILAANGDVLVESRELNRIAVALPEVKDTAGMIRSLRRARIDPAAVRSAIARKRRWIDLPGVFAASDMGSLANMSGVHLTPVLQRVYANSSGIRRIIGSLDPHGKAVDGLELALDTLLRGDSGRATLARDKGGRALETPEAWDEAPRAGSTVVLTINNALQDIAERELAHAVDSLGATGGDIVIMNPHTGEILALASNRVGRNGGTNTAITEPFEPGSTLKPFVAAALLTRKRARPDEIIDTHNGKLEIDGRTITDMHKAPELSLSDVIRFSSNVGIVEFGQRLTPREKYETFRDLGFGMPLGVPLPAESPGTLREPKQWSKQTSASVLMGYEVAVTPLQLVTAYAAIANGGELLQPHLVKEVRSANGETVYRATPQAIRRVMPPDVARTVQQMLLAVVQEGTATKADLETFDVAGKSGTARRTSGSTGYVTGNYTATFVGLFPGKDPQYVVLVKLDSPKGTHYAGGDIAAPVTRIVLRAALAARDAALDRRDLAAVEKNPAPAPLAREKVASTTSGARTNDEQVRAELTAIRSDLAAEKLAEKHAPDNVDESLAQNSSYTIALPAKPNMPSPKIGSSPVPDVRGLNLRQAAKALHTAGFRVRVVAGQNGVTLPTAGTLLPQGSTVQLGHSIE
jgi:cell division protein FtsI (penicillin-binding protein 3)